MKVRLDPLVRQHLSKIIDGWVGRIRNSSLHYAERPTDELRTNVRATLEGALALIRGETQIAFPLAPSLAEMRLDSNFSQAETVRALLFGREVVLDVLKDEIAPAEFVEAAHLLDDAFNRVVADYSRAFCSLCMSRQEERRARVERHLESVVQRSQDAIVLFDENRIVHAWNPGAERIFGFAAVEILDKSLDLIVPPSRDATEEIAWLMREVREREHARIHETQRRRKDGSLVWVDVSYTVVRDRHGHGVGIWAIFRDIGERKRLEEEKLQSERLALVGVMSAKLAHEVRNPLNSLLLGLDLIRDNLGSLACSGDVLVHETQDLVGSIGLEMGRIQQVVEHYLRFAHLPKLQLRSVPLDSMLRGHLDLLRSDLGSRRVALVADLDAGGAHVAADENQLWQAVLNLIRNGGEAMPDGGTVRVSTRVRGSRLECEVADHGIGMTPETKAMIFRPFFSTKSNGTGLGMALTQQIVHEHGGDLSCESELGKGTRFVISLPLAEVQHRAEGMEDPARNRAAS